MVHELHCCYEKCLNSDDRANRTASSVRTYCYNICWLAKRMDGFTETEVPDPDVIMKYMVDNEVSLKRRQMSFSSMKVLHNARNEAAQSKKYAQPLTDVKYKLNKESFQQKRTMTQKKNWIDFKCLKTHAKELRDKTFAMGKNDLWTKDEYAVAQLAFILTFHLKYPIRRDLCTVMYNVPENTDGNNLVGKSFLFKQHKLTRHKKEFTMKLDRVMWRLLQLLRRQHTMRGKTNGHLILNRYWKPILPNSFTNWMKREMGKLESCKGKSVSCLSIRHSVITHRRRNDTTLEQRKLFAENCMHSAAMNELYRIH
jgi:hypothetical protein